MTLERSQYLSVSETGASAPVHESASFDDRWAAWQTKGAVHDRAVRRRIGFAGPILIVVTAAVVYALLGR
jgi:hypothetical protein